MTTLRRLSVALLLLAAFHRAAAQMLPAEPMEPLPAVPAPVFPRVVPAAPDAIQPLLAFRPSDIKFDLSSLMDTLSDRRHEGWVLAAYPDPKTGRPLIGAGVSLDLPERQHPQQDPLNSHTFVEPSSAELWQAAGLDPDHLQQILADFHQHLADWKMRRFRRRIGALEPQITDDQATALLRISAVQAIVNAQAYCRNFDQLTASQQMALSQLVYQMGINLEEFDHFLDLINGGSASGLQGQSTSGPNPEYWRTVQHSLEQSQWARLYRNRAIAVIAMLNPHYEDDPVAAEHQVSAVLHPAVARRHRHRRHTAASLRVASYSRHAGHTHSKRTARHRRKPETEASELQHKLEEQAG